MAEEPTCAHCAGGLSRRQVLRGSATVGAVVVGGTLLAACGGGGSDASTGTPAAGSDSAGGSAGGGASEGASPGPTEGGGSQGSALAKTADIPVGGGKIFEAEKVVVTQPSKGTFEAFSAVCTHAGCIVSEVSDGLIKCPCHGSTYSVKDGSVQDGPAPLPLPAKKVDVSGGEISLA